MYFPEAAPRLGAVASGDKHAIQIARPLPEIKAHAIAPVRFLLRLDLADVIELAVIDGGQVKGERATNGGGKGHGLKVSRDMGPTAPAGVFALGWAPVRPLG